MVFLKIPLCIKMAPQREGTYKLQVNVFQAEWDFNIRLLSFGK